MQKKNSTELGHFCFSNFSRKFQKKVIGGIYAITLHCAKNLNYRIFRNFSCSKTLSGNKNTMNKHDNESKLLKTSIFQKMKMIIFASKFETLSKNNFFSRISGRNLKVKNDLALQNFFLHQMQKSLTRLWVSSGLESCPKFGPR